MGKLIGVVLADTEVVFGDACADEPVEAVLHPLVKPFLVAAWLDKVFDLHLLELAGAEDEVAHGNLVAERLAYLRDAEGQLLARGVQDVEEVDEDALRGLGSEVGLRGVVLHGTEEGLEHEVEHAGV